MPARCLTEVIPKLKQTYGSEVPSTVVKESSCELGMIDDQAIPLSPHLEDCEFLLIQELANNEQLVRGLTMKFVTDEFQHSRVSQQEWALAARLYTHAKPRLYRPVNAALREQSNEYLAKWVQFLHFLNAAIVRLPNLKSDKLYRGEPLSKHNGSYENLAHTGQLICWLAFTSASTNVKVACAFAGSPAVLYEICVPPELRQLVGSLQTMSKFSHEDGFLFPQNSCFEVTRACKGNAEQTRIFLTFRGINLTLSKAQKAEHFTFNQLGLAGAGAEEGLSHKNVCSNIVALIISNKEEEALSALQHHVRNVHFISYKDDKGRTLLYAAARHGCSQVCEWLLKVGAVANTQSKPHNSTPLHAAAHYGHKTCVELLLRYDLHRDLTVHIRNDFDLTAIEEGGIGLRPIFHQFGFS